MSDVVNETTVSDVVPTEPKHAMPHAWRSVFGFWLTLGKWLLLLGALLYVSEALTEGPYSNIFGSGVDLIGYFVMMATPLAAFPAGLRLSIRPGPQLDRRAIVYSLLTIGVVAVLFNGYASPALARMNLRVPPSGYRPPNAQYLHEVRATLRDMKAQRERLTLPKLPNDSSRARVLESFRRESRILRYNIEEWQQHYSLVLAHSILPVIGASLGWVVGLWARLI
ncbi:MAG: hypothetical protein ACRENP_28705, partial [Longimicrobiales bacterium]